MAVTTRSGKGSPLTHEELDANFSKIAGVEDNATADQTGAEIKALYEAESNAYTDTKDTKLSGIEANATADQTDSEVKTAYENNADTNAFTDAEQTKLGAIEAGATTDQTGAEIKALYEANADTNEFSDAEQTKLSGIEASADVTDTTNVASAGALMDSEVTNLSEVKAFDSSDYATAAQGTTADAALPKAGGTMTGDVSLGTNVKAKFGAGDDLQIYHDASHSYIIDNGTGNLRLKAQNFQVLGNADDEAQIEAYQNDGVYLYFNGNQKLTTTSTGIDVTGSVTSDGLTVNDTGGASISYGYSLINSSARNGSGSIQLSSIPSIAMLLDYHDANQTVATVRNTYGATSALAELALDSGFITFNTGTSFTERMRITSAGNVEVNTGNLVIGTSGKGIDFSATSDGSGTMTSEVLDDYETGAWTPRLDGSTTSGTGTYTKNTGYYTKVGNKVHVQGYITTSSLGTMAGFISLRDLPFALSGLSNNYTGINVHYSVGLSLTAGSNLGGFGITNTTTVNMYVWDAGIGTSGMTVAEWSEDGGIIFSMEYIAG